MKSKRSIIVYIAGKYSGPEGKETDYAETGINILKARRIAVEVANKGFTPLCPHLNTAHFQFDCKCTYEDYLKGDLEMLSRCDYICMVPGWEDSPGARVEYDFAKKAGIPIFDINNPPEVCDD